MNAKTQAKLLKIAQDHLGIETLEQRGSDSLDFHDVSIWGVQKALQAAFELGQAQGLAQQKKGK